MKITAYDLGAKPEIVAPKRGFGGAASWAGKITKASKCREAGLSNGAIQQWRRRHPGSHLSDDQVIAVILENKQQRRRA